MAYLGSAMIPALILAVLVCGLARGHAVFDEFSSGVKTGVSNLLMILPSMLGLIVSVEMFKASGALDLLCSALAPLTDRLGIPAEILPLALMRPVSGGASTALVQDIIQSAGPDSFAGRLASVMMGSSETTFYVVAMYFGSAGVKNLRYTLKAALFADLCCFLASVLAVRLMFG